MPTRTSSSSARIFAPLALAVCAVAVLIVIGGSMGGDDSSSVDTGAEQVDPKTAATTARAESPQRATYTVKPGDTLGAIAESTGVPVDVLQELNPELDPQALIAGQKIKLRE